MAKGSRQERRDIAGDICRDASQSAPRLRKAELDSGMLNPRNAIPVFLSAHASTTTFAASGNRRRTCMMGGSRVETKRHSAYQSLSNAHAHKGGSELCSYIQ